MKTKTYLLLAVCIGVFVLVAPELEAQTIEERVQDLEHQVDRVATTGLVLSLFGVFCALWAQEKGRSAWGWFFFGLFLGPIAAVVLLAKNSRDKKSADLQI